MKLIDLLNIIHNTNLIEIVDPDYHRLFYGQVSETVLINVDFIADKEVLSISPFAAPINEDTLVPAIQIVVQL